MNEIDPYSTRTDLIIFGHALLLIAIVYLTFYGSDTG